MKQVKVVKINDVINMEKKNKSDVYKKLISNPEKIKEYIEKKSRKNNILNKIKEQEFKQYFKPKPEKKRTKKNIKSKIKFKSLNKETINKIFKQINHEKKIVNITKENLLKLFREIIETNDINLSNKFIKIITRKQLILILSFLGIINIETNAPSPLLKNILYNCLTSSIKIIY